MFARKFLAQKVNFESAIEHVDYAFLPARYTSNDIAQAMSPGIQNKNEQRLLPRSTMRQSVIVVSAFVFALVCWTGTTAAAEASTGPDFSSSRGRFVVHRMSDATAAALTAVEEKDRDTMRVELSRTCTQQDLAQLAEHTWITELEIGYGNEHIDSFAPLTSLTQLRHFACRSLKQSKEKRFDLAPFAGMPDLQHVDFYGTHVSNTDALANHPRLIYVSLYMSAVDSIDFLKTTPEVRELVLYGTGHTFADYEPVAALPKIRKLDIYMNKQATDEGIKPLAKLTTLHTISMSNSQKLTSLALLEGSNNIRNIGARWCRSLVDISALEDCADLENVVLQDTQITSVEVFAGKTRLRSLDLSGTKMTDLSPLAKCPSLERLDVSKTAVTDLSPLVDLIDLKDLTVGPGVSKDEIESIKAQMPQLTVKFKP